MKKNVTARIYSLIVGRQGMTAREIRSEYERTYNEEMPRHFGIALNNLRKRNAIFAKNVNLPKQLQYYKGNAPAAFRQVGTTQAAVEKPITWSSEVKPTSTMLEIDAVMARMKHHIEKLAKANQMPLWN